MKCLTTLFLLLFMISGRSQELTADASTLLLLHFNNNTTGAAGETPVSSSNISYGTGKHGDALSVAANTTLRFDTTQNLKNTVGTIEFWIKLTSPGAAFGMEVLGGMAIDVGNNVRLLQNVAGSFGNPEIALTANIPQIIGNWQHLAFTWGQGTMKIYLNGAMVGSSTYNFQLQPAPSQFFNIGSYLGQFNQMVGLLDELRISNRIRTDDEINQSYLLGIGGITNLQVRNSNPIVLYKTWNLYLMHPGYYKVPSLYSVRAPGDTVNLPNGLATWTLGNNSVAQVTNGILTAMQAGNTTLTANILGFQVSIPLQVVAPVREPDKPSSLDPFMTTPAECHALTIPVLVIAYLPTTDGITMNLNETDPIPMPAQTVAYTKDFINMIVKNSKFAQEQSSKYRGYNNPDSKPYVGYKIVDIIYVYEPVPRGFPVPWNQGVFFNDYNQILPRFNMQKYVDSFGVKEVWLMGYQKGDLEPPESNMSSPTTGDISNSSRFPDDMPVYSKTYIVYGHNVPVGPYGVGHIYGHQFESMLSQVAIKQDGNANLFVGNFVGRSGPNLQNPPLGRCGDAHHPPNTTVDYDYDNATFVASDIMDWKPAGGTQTMVNKDTWGNLYPNSIWPTPDPNYAFIANPIERHVRWYMMWMQSYPGNGNQIPHGTKWMTNWWRFLADWDSNTVKIGLYQNNPETLQNNCVPYISTGLSATSACIGGSLAINYYSSNVTFNPGNVFTVQLSSITGGFNNPVMVGSLTGTSTTGSININLPADAPPGESYRMRIISSNPAVTSEASNILVINNTAVPPPVINAGGTTTFCTGGNVLLTSNAASGNQWYKDGVMLNGSTGISLNVTNSGSYTASVVLNGCSSGPSNSIVVTVNPVPPTPVITAGAATTFCTGGSVTLNSNAVTGNQWYKNGISIGGSTGTSLNVTVSGSYTVMVTSGGCPSLASNAIIVNVNPAPPAPTITAGGAISFCTGGSVTLNSNAAGGNQWYKDGIAIGGSTGTSLLVTTSGSYRVTVTSGGCESAASNVIIITTSSTPPTPIITAGGAIIFCQGGSVTLNSNAASGNQWYKDGIVIGDATGTSIIATTSGNYTVKVSSGSCQPAASNAITVTVAPAPATPIISAGGAIAFCTGGSVTLTSNAASGNLWYKDGVALGGSTGTSLTVTTSGSYTVTVTSGGCESAFSNSIIVTATPAPPTPIISAGGVTTFCQGGSVTLNSNAPNGNQWYKDDNLMGGSTGTSLIVTSSGNYTVKVSSGGCQSTASNAITVTVAPAPATPTISAGGPLAFCTGGSVTLTSNAASGNQWYKDGVALGGSTGASLIVTTSGSYSVTVTSVGCESAFSNAIAVTANPAPPTPIISAVGATTFCQGGSVTLNSNAPNGNQWYKDGIAIGGSTGTSLIVTTSGSYTVIVTSGGCQSVPSNAIVVSVTPAPITPTITAGGAIAFCMGGIVTLTSNAATGNQWYKDGIVIGGSTGTSLVVTASGSYTVAVTSGGCPSASSNAIVVTVSPVPPTPTITQNGNQLTSNAISGNQWALNNVAIPGATNQNYTPVASGSYTVQVIVNNCASVLSNAINVTVAGIQDLTNSQFFSTTQVAAGGTIDEVIGIRNVGTAGTSAPVVFTLTNYSPLTGLTVSPMITPSVTIGFTTYTLDNVNWTYNPAAGTFTSNAGLIILPGTTRFIGVRITRGTAPGQGANGAVTHTVTIAAGTGGGEIQSNNNSISNTLLKN